MTSTPSNYQIMSDPKILVIETNPPSLHVSTTTSIIPPSLPVSTTTPLSSENNQIASDITKKIISGEKIETLDRTNIMNFVVQSMMLVEKYSGLSGMDKTEIVKVVIKNLILLVPGMNEDEANFLIMIGQDVLPGVIDVVVKASRGLITFTEEIEKDIEVDVEKSGFCGKIKSFFTSIRNKLCVTDDATH